MLSLREGVKGLHLLLHSQVMGIFQVTSFLQPSTFTQLHAKLVKPLSEQMAKCLVGKAKCCGNVAESCRKSYHSTEPITVQEQFYLA